MPDLFTHLPADSNQALGIANYAIDFLSDNPKTTGSPDEAVLTHTNRFMTDAAICGISALALGTNAPTILREEAFEYEVIVGEQGATVFGSGLMVRPEKAIVANCAAVREWDSNGTNFGYNPDRGNTAGEFGHNDFYPVAIAAAQMIGADGAKALKAMVCIDEIRGRLAEVFSLKTYKIDHVLHGAIASAAVYGAMMGATAEQIESAIGMTVAHYIPFRAIRAGKQLSDSKGSSAAISTEAAIMSVHRSMRGFLGPRDIFRNPEAVFRIFEGPGQMFKAVNATDANTEQADASPFDLYLARYGSDFAVMGMHFKLGLYEHQSAGALQAMIDLTAANPALLDNAEAIRSITITAYEPAFGIIGDPAKRNPTTRQSADHSMVYIVATLLRKAIEGKAAGLETRWEDLILLPEDYSADAIANPLTRTLMDKIQFAHGGAEYDSRYPDGIPTGVVIESAGGAKADSGLVMYPSGHARNTTHDLDALLANKWKRLGALASKNPDPIIAKFENFGAKHAGAVADVHDFEFDVKGAFD
ncbi:MAG: MmgE/PrpD family protein [Phycisphaerales bacterium]|nr:MmgE/PrpD family protein [Phycisphaerales bacterium]